jgi:hypothetical protein
MEYNKLSESKTDDQIESKINDQIESKINDQIDQIDQTGNWLDATGSDRIQIDQKLENDEMRDCLNLDDPWDSVLGIYEQNRKPVDQMLSEKVDQCKKREQEKEKEKEKEKGIEKNTRKDRETKREKTTDPKNTKYGQSKKGKNISMYQEDDEVKDYGEEYEYEDYYH